MAFTATELGSLQEILEIPALDLNIVLDRATITTEVEDLIQADIVLWNTYRDNFIRADAGPAGFKGRVSAADNRQAIKGRIANWLNLNLPSAGGNRLVRC